MEIKEILNKIVEDLKKEDPYKIILYRSNAEGIVKVKDEVNLLVELDSEEELDLEGRVERTCKISKKYDLYMYPVISLMVLTRREYELDKEKGLVYITRIEKTGKIIYEK